MLKQPQTKYRAFAPIALPDRRWPDVQITKAPLWLSTDLRDGNQALIEPMDPERKLRMFQMLVKIGFKEIEVGFPSASQTDFDFVRLLIEQGHIPDDVTIQVLTQARQPLIERTFESLVGAKRAVVHLYNAVAPVMCRVVLGMSEDEIVDLAVTHTRMIREFADTQQDTDNRIEYSPDKVSSAELYVSTRHDDEVTEAWGATPERKIIINLPSTVEHSTPNLFADMIEWMGRNVERRDCIVLSVHPHNDRGTGTAAAELSIMAGADRLEGCLFGNGERTGNLDLVNVALNLYTQGVHPGLDFSDIDEIRRCVEHCNQLPVHPRHPYVGELVYTSFSGSHQDAIKKAFAARKDGDVWEIPYLPIDPKDLGRSYEAVIRVNSQSGKGGISYLLEAEYGIELPRRLQIEFSQIVQGVMDTNGKELGAADLWRIFDREYGVKQAPSLHPQIDTAEDGQTRVQAQADLCVRMVKIDGQGKGPIDAFVEGLNKLLKTQVRVLDYHEHAMGSGADAQAVAYLELRVGEATLFGVGMDGNIASASLKAIVSGLRRASQRGVLKLADRVAV